MTTPYGLLSTTPLHLLWQEFETHAADNPFLKIWGQVKKPAQCMVHINNC